MIFRNLTAAGDWTFGSGLGNYARNEDAINLNVKTRILSWVGDCFFALPDGIDWLQLMDPGQQDNLVNAIKSNILNAFGVVGINSVQATLDRITRAILLQYNIDTIFSPSFQGRIRISAGAGGTDA